MLVSTKYVPCSESQNPRCLWLSHNKASYKNKLKLDSLLKERNTFEEYCLLGDDTVWSGRGSQMFQRNLLPPSSGLKSKPSKQYVLLKKLVNFCQTTYHIPEDSMLHSHPCMNIKSNTDLTYFDCLHMWLQFHACFFCFLSS